MLHLKLACAILATSACVHLFAQNSVNTVDSLASGFIKSLNSVSGEKIFLQTDRKVYAAGEKIWFNAFLVKAINNRPDTSSKNLFVDVVNDKDQVIKQLVLNTVKHHTGGAIELSDTLGTGYYWLRSYTQRMLKGDTGSLFIQPLYILNFNAPVTESAAHPKQSRGLLKMHFFPEGGSIITGILSTGALQVTDAEGTPVITSGHIINGHDSVVCGFTTNRFGFARVGFYPEWGQKYQAVIRSGSQDIKHTLESLNPFAAQISVVRNDNDSLVIQINLGDSVYSSNYTTYILGLSKDSVCFAGIARGMCRVRIPIENFPGGVADLLLFDKNKQLLSERKVFINDDNFSVDITADKKTYPARHLANIDIRVKNFDGAPLVAALNIAVEDDKVMQMSNALEADTLQPPGLPLDDWLQRDKSKLTSEEIDLMMMAQAPIYKNLPSDGAGNALEPADSSELLVNVRGKILDYKDKPLKGRVVTGLQKNGSNAFADVDTTGIGGGFRLHLPDNADNMPFILQVTDKHGYPETGFSVQVDTFNFPRFSTPATLKTKYILTGLKLEALIRKFHADTVFAGIGKEWLTPVTVKTKARKPDTYITSKRLSDFSHIILPEKFGYGGSGNLKIALLMSPGVTLRGGYIAVLGGDGQGGSPTSEPIVIMDGVQIPVTITEASFPGEQEVSPVLKFLNSLSPRDIDFIEVLSGAEAAIYGMRGGNGVISINTKTYTGNFAGGNSGLRIISPKTYHTAPPFIMPDYSNEALKNFKGRDERNTIYWAGNIITDEGGKASVSFYTADVPTTYSVIVTGITANGDYVYKRITINRK